MTISAQEVKELRDMTGAGLMDCKKALVEADGDMDKARTVLREQGLAEAREKRGRETSEGSIASYVHSNGRIGVLVEVACETDFVARNAEFQLLGKELAMQVAAMQPDAVRPEDLPEDIVQAEKEVYLEQFSDKPEEIRERIAEGKLEKFYEQACLMEQPYIRDDSKQVKDVVAEAVAKLGENIEVRRFVRLEVGE